MRTYQHIIDTKAVRMVINNTPEYTVVRELTERDYGIDLMIEIFAKVGENEKGHELYDSTGHVCYLQIKGIDRPFKFRRDKTIAYNIDKKSLFYVEKFATPFILTRACTKKGYEAIYFIWLQKYISEVLDIKTPDWRTDKKDSLTIYIPIHNDFQDNFSKVEKISHRIKYIEELSEYCEFFAFFELCLDEIIMHGEKYKHYEYFEISLKRIYNLDTLLSKNYCCITKQCVLNLINYLKEVKDGEIFPKEYNDFPHHFNFNMLRTTIDSSNGVAQLQAENDKDTTY